MTNRAFQIAAWAALAGILFATLSPIQMRPGDILSVDADRALAFTLLTALFMLAYPRQALWLGAIMILSAGVIELLQALSPTRHARIDDAVIKAGGAALGVVLASWVNVMRSAWGKHYAGRFEQPIRSNQYMKLSDTMRQLPVTSRLIQSVYFSPEDGQLRIRMHTGEERLFEGVPDAEALSLVTAASPGDYYLKEIRPKFHRAA